jgi:hypothetical protein
VAPSNDCLIVDRRADLRDRRPLSWTGWIVISNDRSPPMLSFSIAHIRRLGTRGPVGMRAIAVIATRAGPLDCGWLWRRGTNRLPGEARVSRAIAGDVGQATAVGIHNVDVSVADETDQRAVGAQTGFPSSDGPSVNLVRCEPSASIR